MDFHVLGLKVWVWDKSKTKKYMHKRQHNNTNNN